MSEATKIKQTDKKLNKGILKNNNNIDNKSNINTIKKDTTSISQKAKKVVHNTLQSNQRKFQDKNKSKKKNEDGISFNLVFKQGRFLNNPKILKNFISFFNIRELFIIMELDSHIFHEIKDSNVFKKYLLIRKDFESKDDNKMNIHKKKLKVITDDKISGIIPLAKKSKESNNIDKNGQDKEQENKKFELSLPSINFKKLKIKYLINNNCQVIKKYIKTYSLNNSESHTIFNGIIEFLVIKENGIPMENRDPKIFSLSYFKNVNGFNYYIESLMNLNYPNIIKLDLSNIGISSINTMKKLCLIFKRYSTSLRILSLSNNSIDDKCAKLLFSGLENNQVLEILNLSYNEIGEEGLETNFFNSIKTLLSLSFNHNLLGPNGIDYLFNYFISNKYMHLKSLELGYNGITREGTEYISKYVKNNQYLNNINIQGNYLCDEGTKIICESLSQKKNINYVSYVDLQNNNITNKGCIYISKMLSESPFLNGISLRNNLLYNDGINKIISSLKSQNSNLISLDISDVKIDEKAMNTISENINKDISLQKLILSYNDFSNSGNYINNLLTKESNLKYLDLSFCNISTQFNIIFQGLSKNQNLKFVNFSGNYIPMKKDILNELGKVLIENIFLKHFILNECNIDDIGMNYIIQYLEKNHSLMTLSLNHNFLTKKSIFDLENAIIKNGIIKNIYLYENNEVDINLINKIENTLKNNNKIVNNSTNTKIDNDAN